MGTIPKGFVRESDDVYHQQYGKTYIGSSLAKLALQSRRLVKDRMDGISIIEPSKAMILGQAWDRVLSYGKANAFLAMPDGITKNNKEGKALVADAAAAGVPLVSYDESLAIERALDRTPSAIKSMIDKANAEGMTQLSARCEYDGVSMQMRADMIDVQGSTIYDVKFTGQPLEAFNNHAIKMGYHVQAGWYRFIATCCTGREWNFAFIVTESKPPYRTAIFMPAEDWLEYGDAQAAEARLIIANAIRSDDWTDPDDGMIRTLTLPAWASSADVVQGDDGSIDLE